MMLLEHRPSLGARFWAYLALGEDVLLMLLSWAAAVPLAIWAWSAFGPTIAVLLGGMLVVWGLALLALIAVVRRVLRSEARRARWGRGRT